MKKELKGILVMLLCATGCRSGDNMDMTYNTLNCDENSVLHDQSSTTVGEGGITYPVASIPTKMAEDRCSAGGDCRILLSDDSGKSLVEHCVGITFPKN